MTGWHLVVSLWVACAVGVVAGSVVTRVIDAGESVRVRLEREEAYPEWEWPEGWPSFAMLPAATRWDSPAADPVGDVVEAIESARRHFRRAAS